MGNSYPCNGIFTPHLTTSKDSDRNSHEPHHDLGFLTSIDSNQHAQLQRLATCSLEIQDLACIGIILSRQWTTKADQTARMPRLICAFVRIWQKQVFSWRGSRDWPVQGNVVLLMEHFDITFWHFDVSFDNILCHNSVTSVANLSFMPNMATSMLVEGAGGRCFLAANPENVA